MTADVVIVGGGVVGSCTLAWLGRFALASDRDGRDSVRLRELADASRRLYDELAPDVPVRTAGLLHLARGERTWRSERRTAERLAAIGVRSEELDPAAPARIEPGLADGFAGAIHFPDDGTLDPDRTTTAFAAAAVRHGACTGRHGVRWLGGRRARPASRGGTPRPRNAPCLRWPTSMTPGTPLRGARPMTPAAFR